MLIGKIRFLFNVGTSSTTNNRKIPLRPHSTTTYNAANAINMMISIVFTDSELRNNDLTYPLAPKEKQLVSEALTYLSYYLHSFCYYVPLDYENAY